jgi:Spy/CpxP family protein refolding chaperone
VKKGKLVVLGVLGALAMLIAGCGGGGDDTTATLTKAEFIKQGDAICKKGNETSEAETEDLAKEGNFQLEKLSEEQAEEVVTEVMAPNLKRQAEEIDALEAPKGDEAKVDALVASIDEAVAEFEKDPGSFFEETALAKPIRLENAYGFKICGGG